MIIFKINSEVFDEHFCMTKMSQELLSSDLIVYYLLAIRFIFNLFPWPAALDSDSHIFHRSLSFLAMNNLELFLGLVLSLFKQIQQCETHHHLLSQLPSCSHLGLFLIFFRNCEMLRMASTQLRDKLHNKWPKSIITCQHIFWISFDSVKLKTYR